MARTALQKLGVSTDLDAITSDARDTFVPEALIGVFGGAAGLYDLLTPNLRRLIVEGVVPAACDAHALVVDGGTKSGVMQMVGEGLGRLGSEHVGGVAALGVVPAGAVCFDAPAGHSAATSSFGAGETALAPYHSRFLMAPSSEWGGETGTMMCVVKCVADVVPAVALFANGGLISKLEMLNVVRLGVPVVVVAGSGRLADQVAKLVAMRDDGTLARAKEASKHGKQLSSEVAAAMHTLDDDAALSEIIAKGRVRLLPISSRPSALRAALAEELAAARSALLPK